MKSINITNHYNFLGEIADIMSGVFVKPSLGGEISYLQVRDLTMSPQITPSTRVDYSPRFRDLILRKGDLLFVGKGSRYLCQVFELNITAVPSTAFFIIRPNRSRVLPEYLCWYLNQPKVIAAVKTVQAGGGTPMIHKPTLEQLEIIVPDLETQRFVVEVSRLQRREGQLLKSLAEKRVQLTNQLLYNEIINK